MKHNVPHVKACDLNRRFVREVAEIQDQRGDIRRVQAADSPFPEGEEIDYRRLHPRRARFGPKEMDTKPGDNKEKVYAGIREMNYVAGDLRIRKQVLQLRIRPAWANA